jgi:hypothetical protein
LGATPAFRQGSCHPLYLFLQTQKATQKKDVAAVTCAVLKFKIRAIAKDKRKMI